MGLWSLIHVLLITIVHVPCLYVAPSKSHYQHKRVTMLFDSLGPLRKLAFIVILGSWAFSIIALITNYIVSFLGFFLPVKISIIVFASTN